MTRDEIIKRVVEIIAGTVEGYAYYESRSSRAGGTPQYLTLDYPVALDEDSVARAAAGIADFLNDFVRDADR